jgi:hypothetical protein
MAIAEEKISIIRNEMSISHCTRRITKIISCVQTGADHAALDVTIEKEIPSAVGFRGRKTQDALVPEKYQRKEMESPALRNEPSRGSTLTAS